MRGGAHHVQPCRHARALTLARSYSSAQKTRIQVWLFENTDLRIEGRIIGFDEYMNMVLDDAVEIGKKRKEIGRILLKGDSITLLQEAQPQKKQEPMQE